MHRQGAERHRGRTSRTWWVTFDIAELANQPKANGLYAADVYVMINSLGDIGAMIGQARPESLTKLYRDVRLEVRYRPSTDSAEATATIGVAKTDRQ